MYLIFILFLFCEVGSRYIPVVTYLTLLYLSLSRKVERLSEGRPDR